MNENNMTTMKSLPESERPYERCVKYGAHVLTDAELIAILIKSGTKDESAIDIAKRLLIGDVDNLNGLVKLKAMDYPDYIRYKGIGSVKAVTLMAAVELGKRLSLTVKEQSIVYTSPRTIADYYIEEMNAFDTEHFYMLLLNSKNALIKKLEIFKGTVNQVNVSTRECMIEALKYGAVSFVIMHNHPSGDPTPSAEDYAVTDKMRLAGDMVDIRMIDHIIIGDRTYFSMCEENYI